ncbi:MAG: glycogen/starch/alpha-glucan phosphorylase [Oscillospiraceae bacterium]|nr:glycogen/starch/alpha-glucan phosphorylase [Oscillospiraceae bacterium]
MLQKNNDNNGNTKKKPAADNTAAINAASVKARPLPYATAAGIAPPFAEDDMDMPYGAYEDYGHLSPSAQEMRRAIIGKTYRHFARDVQTASREQLFRACALVIKDRISLRLPKTLEEHAKRGERQVHYLSLEFLLGRSLAKNAFNLGIYDDMKDALESLGADISDITETEPDAGLGNGGLGRLAACYLDSLTTLGIPATGYSICYHYGIFRQKILDGQQVELPDPWMTVGDVWLIPSVDESEEIRFGGTVEEYWENDMLRKRLVNYSSVQAVPMDMHVAGYGTKHVNTLRLWDAKSADVLDMSLFSRGEYMKAVERNAMAEVISKILYPEDNHFEGKLLRLRQQYFFVSATLQSIVRKHRAQYGTLDNFHVRHVIHINDTHPTLVIPELMRILLDEEFMFWEHAWGIVSRTVAYTNHTVLAEALECWPQDIFEMLLPRLWQIICECNDRYLRMLREAYPGDVARHSVMAIVWDGQVRMANLCVYACYAVNGVSQLHSNILRSTIFKPEFELWPGKFYNVTNGVDHRRWLAQINPGLHSLICEVTGSDSYLKRPTDLEKLAKAADNPGVQNRWEHVKRWNKSDFSDWLFRAQGVRVDPDTLFDVQVKRLHEYKRQLLNVLHIISLYQRLRDDPNADIQPRTFLMGAKAASGYHIAKRIIQLINSLANEIERNPRVSSMLRLVFLENYRVSMAEHLMPASEISEQISLAGKEASGTGNMKFMLNGAVTVGTLDGANVEMYEVLGPDNIFIFGLTTQEVEQMRETGYSPLQYYAQNHVLKEAVDQIAVGFSDGESYQDIANSLLLGNPPDTYMLCADFESYRLCQLDAAAAYADRGRWNRMSIMNTAQAGVFASDRSVTQYAKHIWNV